MATLLTKDNVNCPYHIYFEVQDPFMRIDRLQMSFDSSYAFLYESVMGLLTQTVIELFNEKLSKELLVSGFKIAQDQINRIDPGLSLTKINDKYVNSDSRVT